eukprot:444512_1
MLWGEHSLHFNFSLEALLVLLGLLGLGVPAHILGGQHHLEVLLWVTADTDTKVLDQDAEDIGGDEGGQRGSDVDGLEAQVQAGQQDGDGLLLEPGEHDGQGKVLDLALQRAGQTHGDLHRGEGVVALAHVEDAGDPSVANVAQVEVVQAVLAAADGEDDGGGGKLGHQLGVVGALALEAVAAADDEEAGDVALLDLLDDGGGHGEDGVVAEANRVVHGALDADGVGVAEGLGLRVEALGSLGGRDQGIEVDVLHGVANVGHVLPADGASGEDAGSVGLVGLRDAVGGHEDRAGEVRELDGLAHPGATEVTDQVLEGVEVGVGVAGQHLTVGVDVDAQGLRLLEEALQDDEVVARHEDALTGGGHVGHLGDGGHTEGLVGVAQQGHGGDVDLAGLEAHAQALAQVEALVARHQVQGAVDELVDLLVLLVVHQAVVGVGGDALEAVDQHLGDTRGGLSVGVDEAAQDTDVLALVDEGLDVAGRLALIHGGHRDGGLLDGSLARGLAGLLVSHAGLGAGTAHVLENHDEALGVEVDVGQGGEHGVQSQAVQLVHLGRVHQSQLVEVEAKDLAAVDREVLQGGDLGGLAADADLGAATALEGLLALEAEHVALAHAGRQRLGALRRARVRLDQVLRVEVSREVVLVVALGAAHRADVEAGLAQTALHKERHAAA